MSDQERTLMQEIDKIYTQYPFYGSRKITAVLSRRGHCINRKRVQRVMRKLGLASNQPRLGLSVGNKAHKKFPYLLNGLDIIKPAQVWSTDITYIRLRSGFVYLVAVIDWYSRLVLSHRLSNSLQGDFCVDALGEAVSIYGHPEIFNTDQGVQFTCQEFVNAVTSQGIQLSMDGKGRALDNVFVERLWRSLKYEEVYQHEYVTVQQARQGIEKYFRYYNTERPHQSLGYSTPYEVHYGKRVKE